MVWPVLEFRALRCGRATSPDIALLQRAVGELEEPRAQNIAVACVASDYAIGLHRAQKSEHGRLMNVEPSRQLLK